MRVFCFFITTILGIACTWTGIWLRLKANDLAWPREWGYRGPREDTIWAMHLLNLQQVIGFQHGRQPNKAHTRRWVRTAFLGHLSDWRLVPFRR